MRKMEKVKKNKTGQKWNFQYNRALMPSKGKSRLEALDTIRVHFAFVEGGSLRVEAFADYGPIKVPLMSLGEYDADRDWDIEGEARIFLAHAYPMVPTDEAHVFRVPAEEIYYFSKDVLPEIEYRYTVDADKKTLDRMTIKRLSIAPDLGITSSRAGWFDFSIAWHCEQAEVDTRSIIQAVKSGQPFIRAADGSLIEYDNPEELERMAEFLERAEQDKEGHFSTRLFDAPEMVALIEQIRSSRVESTDAAFTRFLEEAKKGMAIEKIALPALLDETLRPYQKDGVSWMAFLRKYGFGGILADDMGLGKTLQVLAYLSVTRKPGDAPDLVVCPKTLTLTWWDEAQKYTPNLKTLVIQGTADERSDLLESVDTYDLVITTYPAIQRDLEAYLERGKPFRMCVLDEAQYIKNPATATAKSAKLIPADFRMALTGTPLENGVHELWSIFDFLMPGFLGSMQDFRKRYERPIRDRQDQAALERLRTRIRPFMLRRSKSTMLKELPPKVEQTSHASLTPEQLVVYARTLEEVRANVMKAVAEKGFQQSRIEILTALMKLRRICDHPTLVDPRLPRTEELSGKMGLALELVRQAKEGGHKVLLFSQFTGMLDLLREALDRAEIGHATIEGKTRDRGGEIKKFSSDPKVTVFLLSLRAGGTGLTLTEADTVILFDPWWNPMVEAQAMDRAHRIGQTKTVNVYKLVTSGSVEEKVMELQVRKKQLFDALVQESEAELAALTWEEVKGLFE